MSNHIANVEWYKPERGNSLICALVLSSGFVVVGQCIFDPELYDEEYFKQLSLEDAESKLTELEGYALIQYQYYTGLQNVQAEEV